MPELTIKEHIANVLDDAIFKQGRDDLVRMSSDQLAKTLQQADQFLEMAPFLEVKEAVRDYMEQN